MFSSDFRQKINTWSSTSINNGGIWYECNHIIGQAKGSPHAERPGILKYNTTLHVHKTQRAILAEVGNLDLPYKT